MDGSVPRRLLIGLSAFALVTALGAASPAFAEVGPAGTVAPMCGGDKDGDDEGGDTAARVGPEAPAALCDGDKGDEDEGGKAAASSRPAPAALCDGKDGDGDDGDMS